MKKSTAGSAAPDSPPADRPQLELTEGDMLPTNASSPGSLPAESNADEAPPADEESRPDVLQPGDELIGGSWVRQEDGTLVRSQEA